MLKLTRWLFIIPLLCSMAWASDTYFAPTLAGSNNGTNCANAYAYNDGTHGLGVSGTWAAGANLHLCTGTYTGSAGGSNFIQAQNSGSSGNPITLIADQGAVTITATYWSGAVLNLAGLSYITVNGDNNLTIQATANGSALANQQDGGRCVSNGSPAGVSTDITVENLTCANLYVDSSVTDAVGSNTFCLDLWNITNLFMSGNTLHDCYGQRFSYGVGHTYSNFNFFNNTVYNINWGLFITDSSSSGTATVTGFYIYGNNIHDWSNWDNSSDDNHHDGMILNTDSATSSFSNWYIYNNYIHGNIGSYMSAMIFSFPGTPTPTAISNIWFFNNLFSNDATAYCTADGIVDPLDSTIYFINNTVVSNHTSCTQFSAQPEVGFNVGNAGVTIPTVQVNNNIFVNTNGYAEQWGPHTPSSATSNYNDFYQNGGFQFGASTYTTLAQWQTGSSQDANSSTLTPNLNSSSSPPYQLNGASGAAYRAGTNLYSTFGCTSPVVPGLGAGCSDYLGNPRPSSGSWDMGAFYFTSGTVTPAPALGMFAWDWDPLEGIAP